MIDSVLSLFSTQPLFSQAKPKTTDMSVAKLLVKQTFIICTNTLKLNSSNQADLSSVHASM